jgi:hemerythrin
MALITWTKEQYGTDVAFADEEHKTLFNLLNGLHEVASSGDKQTVGQHLDGLIDFVVEHFQHEERTMQEKGYSGFEAHKAEHDKFVAICADLQKKFHAGEAEISEETTAFVKSWLDTHIPNIDMPYAPCLNG